MSIHKFGFFPPQMSTPKLSSILNNLDSNPPPESKPPSKVSPQRIMYFLWRSPLQRAPFQGLTIQTIQFQNIMQQNPNTNLNEFFLLNMDFVIF